MRLVRGAKELSKYLDSIGAPISESTIFTLLRQNRIPCRRPTPRILIFNLNHIDEWLEGGMQFEEGNQGNQSNDRALVYR